MSFKSFKTLYVWDTKYNADSVEWCPIVPHQNSFACGLYHLSDKRNGDVKEGYQRCGGVILFTVIKEALKLECSIQCPAVLDLKWCAKKLNGNIALASANGDGEVTLFYLKDLKLKTVSKCKLKLNEENYLVCAIDWVKKDFPDLICASDSKGNLSLIKVDNDSLSLLKKWNAHLMEAWTTCFDSFNQNTIYSGGDEGELKIWDQRSEEIIKISSISKHSAGVTALNSNLYKEYNLVSGSYDETIIFWDSRSMKRPIGQIQASGGVWRLKWEPACRSFYLLAACIYGGFQIYDTRTYSVVGEYKEHESLAYGADWSYLSKDEIKNLVGFEEFLIATCSFYDKKLCVSAWNESEITKN